MSVLSSGPWPGAASEEGFKTDEVAQVDEEQGQHPDDQPHHHLDGQHRPGLRLAETTWAKLFSHFNVELEQGRAQGAGKLQYALLKQSAPMVHCSYIG